MKEVCWWIILHCDCDLNGITLKNDCHIKVEICMQMCTIHTLTYFIRIFSSFGLWKTQDKSSFQNGSVDKRYVWVEQWNEVIARLQMKIITLVLVKRWCSRQTKGVLHFFRTILSKSASASSTSYIRILSYIGWVRHGRDSDFPLNLPQLEHTKIFFFISLNSLLSKFEDVEDD